MVKRGLQVVRKPSRPKMPAAGREKSPKRNGDSDAVIHQNLYMAIIDHRIPPGTPFLCEAGSTDQRGTVRPVGGGCDSGAVEGSAGSIRVLDPVVDTAGDQPDAAPGDGVCATAGGGCTLRAAAQEINALNPGLSTVEHIITIAPGIHPTLSIPGTNEDLGATGDVDVRVPVVIEGGGAVLDGAGLRVVMQDGNETLPRRIVASHEAGIPVMAIVGGREAADNTVTLRRRDGSQSVAKLEDAAALLAVTPPS